MSATCLNPDKNETVVCANCHKPFQARKCAHAKVCSNECKAPHLSRLFKGRRLQPPQSRAAKAIAKANSDEKQRGRNTRHNERRRQAPTQAVHDDLIREWILDMRAAEKRVGN